MTKQKPNPIKRKVEDKGHALQQQKGTVIFLLTYSKRSSTRLVCQKTIAVCKQRNLKGNCETHHKGKYGILTEKKNIFFIFLDSDSEDEALPHRTKPRYLPCRMTLRVFYDFML